MLAKTQPIVAEEIMKQLPVLRQFTEEEINRNNWRERLAYYKLVLGNTLPIMTKQKDRSEILKILDVYSARNRSLL